MLPAELWTFRDFGVGSLDVEGASDVNRGCKEPVVFRDVLQLELDAAEMVELYLRLLSGVVRDDEGVGTFRGSIEGDLEDPRGVKAGYESGCGVGGVPGTTIGPP